MSRQAKGPGLLGKGAALLAVEVDPEGIRTDRDAKGVDPARMRMDPEGKGIDLDRIRTDPEAD